MFYLEDLNLREIKFLKDLLEAYRKDNEKQDISLPPFYHTLKKKVKMLSKYASYNPCNQYAPKEKSKYSSHKNKGKIIPFKKEYVRREKESGYE
jgi:hypothetical protein